MLEGCAAGVLDALHHRRNTALSGTASGLARMLGQFNSGLPVLPIGRSRLESFLGAGEASTVEPDEFVEIIKTLLNP
ncbi:hypothetical protein ACIPYQ_01230 [Streptomyces sp. NPDC090045]|uniref:hypothetical protein n=1 Tax=unclassified Streptomyces TaxID=2593676 RepID=UPI002888B0A0|nr:hypothetical protein [Streptomyces sp. DSM 41633]